MLRFSVYRPAADADRAGERQLARRNFVAEATIFAWRRRRDASSSSRKTGRRGTGVVDNAASRRRSKLVRMRPRIGRRRQEERGAGESSADCRAFRSEFPSRFHCRVGLIQTGSNTNTNTQKRHRLAALITDSIKDLPSPC